jgi:hypothetical protein
MQGRFTTPDQPFADQDTAYPQSWHLYSYVRNNPLKYIDELGRDITYASPELEAISTALRAESPSYDSALKGYEGKDAPNLAVGYGAAGIDPNGRDLNLGLTHTEILDEHPNNDGSGYPAKPIVTTIVPAKLTSATIIIDSSLKGDAAKSENVLKHEVGHANHARTDPKTYLDNATVTTNNKGKTPHDQRPNEKVANAFRDQVNKEQKDYQRKQKEAEKQRKREEKKKDRSPE